MISKEQIAHDLAIVYMKNIYGIDINGDISINDGYGTGTITTEYLPSTKTPKFVKVETGKKNFLGIKQTEKIQSGMVVDSLFEEMLEEYYSAYSHFYNLLNNK